MRLSVLLATAAIAAAVPVLASAAVMVARFDGVIGGGFGGYSTGSTRFGFPALYVPTGAFAAEVRYDPTLGSPLAAGPGAESRNAAAILDAWIEFEGVRVDLPSAEYGEVRSGPTGFSILAQHYVPNTVLDTLSLSANVAGVGDLDLPVGSRAVTGGGSIQAASNYATGVFTIDLFGNCSYECGGMPLTVTKFSLSEYAATAPSAAPEPGAWALMILGFGGAGAVLRRRKPVMA